MRKQAAVRVGLSPLAPVLRGEGSGVRGDCKDSPVSARPTPPAPLSRQEVPGRGGQSRRGSARSGFTLLELLLSLGLTVVLLGVVFTALDLHWRFTLTGHEEVARGQVARAVFTRMAADIRSVVYRPESQSSVSSTSSDSTSTDTQSDGSTSTGTTGTGTAATGTPIGSGTATGSANSSTSPTKKDPTELTTPSDAYSGGSLGVFGDSEMLVMHVSRPDRRSRGTNDVSVNPNSASDLKSVSYFLAGSSTGTLPTFLPPGSGGNGDSAASGLTRTSADRLTLVQAGENIELATAASTSELLADEIETLSFEYHDGFEWLTSWDSQEEGRLPNAIGISISFKAPSGPAGSFVRRGASEMTDRYRIVITLPVANSFESLAP